MSVERLRKDENYLAFDRRLAVLGRGAKFLGFYGFWPPLAPLYPLKATSCAVCGLSAYETPTPPINWSEEDALLRGMIEYKARKGTEPYAMNLLHHQGDKNEEV